MITNHSAAFSFFQLVGFLLTLAASCLAQEHQHRNGEKLGVVHFATSCNEVAQKEFNRAVALLHSFQFSRAIEGFNAVLGEDATCGIAYWGTALSDIQTLNFSGVISGTDCLDTSNGGTHQSDWRLPNVMELHSLVDYEFALPAVPNAGGTGQWTAGDPFINVQGTVNGGGRYWSSTTNALTPANGWEVDLSVGTVNRNSTKAAQYHVWPVRGGQTIP